MNGRFFKKAFFIYIFALFLVALVIHLYEDRQPISNYVSNESIGEINITTTTNKRLVELKHEEFKPKVVHYKNMRWAADIEESSYPTINITAVEEVMQDRHRKVIANCQSFLTPTEIEKPVNSREFLVSDKYKLIWCNIFKSASSSWLYNFILMAGVTDADMKKSNTSPIEFARQYYERPSVEKLEKFNHGGHNYTSFIIVRDPFERLLSAYRDKLESQAQKYYKSLRCKIESEYGHRTPVKGRDCQPKFPEFVDYVVNEHSKGNHPNEHWAPYYSFCSPCQYQFDYILHFETLAQDEAFLVQAVDGLSSVVTPHKLHSSHTDYEELTQKYLSQLTQQQLESLYSIYEKDFKIFDYDVNKYFGYSNSNL